ncbi:MAG: type-F conjugative transfer system secretin TraK [Opitutaceae bacterium]|nr:type-F conjugative transfer system secretin TraK [Opitutaceae bacterium]
MDNVQDEVAAGMNRSLKVALHHWPKVTPTATGRSGGTIGPQNILATKGVNYVVPASGLTTNLLVTPFNHPVVITPNTHDFQPIVRGDQIYYTITQNHPVGIFITGRNRNDPSISLTLVPRRIPAQTYFVTIPGYRKRIEPVADDSSGGSAVVSSIRSEMAPARPRTPHPTNTSTYVSDLTQAMRAAALGHVPEGFRQAPLSIGVVHRGPLTITGQSILVGNGQSIAEFMVVNNSTNFVNLVENDFWHKGVEAVSFYPNVRLIPGDSTVAIVAFQDGLHTGFGSVWRH